MFLHSLHSDSGGYSANSMATVLLSHCACYTACRATHCCATHQVPRSIALLNFVSRPPWRPTGLLPGARMPGQVLHKQKISICMRSTVFQVNRRVYCCWRENLRHWDVRVTKPELEHSWNTWCRGH